MTSKRKKFVPAPRLVCVEENPGPRPSTPLEEEKRWKIVFFKKEMKLNNSQIARKCKTTRSTVLDTLQRYEQTGTVHDRPHPGKKRKLSTAEVKEVVKKAKKKKCAPEIARQLNNKVSPSTIQRTLKREGLFYGRIKKVERLFERHKKSRVKYAREMKGFEWKSVLFSDEKSFWLGSGPSHAWQKPGERLEIDWDQYPPKLHVWGAVGAHMKSKLYFFEENMNGELYQKIIKARLKENQLKYSPNCPSRLRKNWHFLQDNDPKHKAKKSMELLRKLMGTRIISHPSKSPDLNPMEDMWSYLDQKVKVAKCTTISSLKRVLTKEWNALSWSQIRKSTSSMDRRLDKVIEMRGARIPY